jgi:ABC-2 type transport system ATP-binding protein
VRKCCRLESWLSLLGFCDWFSQNPIQNYQRLSFFSKSQILNLDENEIGYVSENQEMPGRLTVDEYLDYLRPFYPKWDKGLETLIRHQLFLPPDRKISDLSHGMRMKMALACALPYRPRLLILDEPFSGLDPLVRDEFMEGLLQQAGEMTILISSHDLGEIDGVATHVTFLDQGRLLFEERLDELMDRFREVRVTLEREQRVPERPPKNWLQLRTAGNVLTFVDTQFSEEDLGDQVRGLFDGVRTIDAQPMTLRFIFTTLARSARNGSG